MKIITLDSGCYCLVDTKGIYYNFRLPKSKRLQGKLYASGGYNGNSWELPSGQWSIIGLAKDLSEDEWRKIFVKREDVARSFYENNTESGKSLLTANGFGLDTLILKKK